MRVVKLLDNPIEHGGVALGVFGQIIEGEWGDAVKGDRISCRISVPVESKIWRDGTVKHWRTIVIVDDDEEVFQYLVTADDRDRSQGNIVISGGWLGLDLGRAMVYATVGGVATTKIEFVDLLPSEIITTYCIPAMAEIGRDYFVLGSNMPTTRLSMSFEAKSPLYLIQQIAEQTQSEFWLERDPGVAQEIHIGTRGATAARPVFMVGNNIASLRTKQNAGARFWTRGWPAGSLIEGMIEPTHMGQHAMRIASKPSAGVLEIDNPDDTSESPIGFDDQLNGTRALIGMPPIPIDNVWFATKGITYDTSRHRVIMSATTSATFGAAMLIYWYDIATGDRGSFSISGVADIGNVYYHPANDRLYVCCRDTDQVKVIDASNYASVVATITVNDSPRHFRYLPDASRLIVISDVGISNVLPQAINPATNAVTLTFSTTYASAGVAYHAGTDKYFIIDGNVSPDQTRIRVLSGTTGASLNQTVINSVAAVFADATTVYLITTGNTIRTFDPTTYAVGAPVSMTGGAYGGAIVSPVSPVVSGTVFIPLSGGPSFGRLNLTTGVVDAGVYGASGPSQLQWIEALSMWIVWDAITICAFFRKPNGLLSAFVETDIADTRTSGSEIDVDAYATTMAPVGAHVEFRLNSSYDYLQYIKDQIASQEPPNGYGIIDARPQFEIVAKRNYYRNGDFSEWASNGRPKHVQQLMTEAYSGAITQHPDYSSRWQLADAPAVAHTGTACQADGSTAAGAATMGIKGLTPGDVIQPGDVFADSASGISGGKWFMVRRRVVVDGAGKATVPIMPAATGTLANNTNMKYYAPRITLPTGQADCMVQMYPRSRGVTPETSLLASTLDFTLPLPALISDAAGMWVVSGLVRTIGGTPSTLWGGDDPGETEGELLKFTLAGNMSLQPGSQYYRIPFSTALFGANPATVIVAYITRVAFYIHPSLNVDELATLIGPVGGGNALWMNVLRLFTRYNRSSPTRTFDVSAIEIPATKKVAVGATIDLRDHANQLFEEPRAIEVRRKMSHPNEAKRLPIMVLDSQPESLIDRIVSGE